MSIISRSPIGQGYGLTETCAGGTFCDFDDTSVGRVGPPLPCSFVKVKAYPGFNPYLLRIIVFICWELGSFVGSYYVRVASYDSVGRLA